MEQVQINVTEEIENVDITISENIEYVDISPTEIIEQVTITVSEEIEQVAITVTEEVEYVSIIIAEGQGGDVDSVNGQTGAVVLTTGDLEEDADHNYVTDAQKTVIEATSGSNTGDQDLSGKEDVGVAQGIMDTHEGNHPAPTTRDARNQIAGDYEPAKGEDDNYVTDAEKVVIGNTSNTNTGDQDISGIATNASDISDIENEQVTQNTAIGLNTAKDTNVSTNLSEGTATETTVDVNSSDGANATLAAASTSRAGVLTKAKFDEIVVNNAKTSNATHSGDAAGSDELTLATVNSDVGTFRSANVTVNAKGLVTAAENGEAVSSIAYSGTLNVSFGTSSFRVSDPITGITTVNIFNLPEGISTLVINQNGTGYTITIGTGWGTAVDNNNTLTDTANAKNIIQFINDGTDVSYIINTVGA